ncbi:MAG: hypothetical protein ACUVQY_10830 [Thermoproteota archaeon]
MGGYTRKIVNLKKFGDVDQVLVDKILDIVVECYERLGPPTTYSVDLLVFERSEADMFFATHDASSGKPTISVYVDKLSGLPPDMFEGGVRRQAAHSILHGSPEFYRIRLPYELRRAMVEYSLPQDFASKVLYGVSMSVKEYHVTKFLMEGGFVEDQVAYAKYMLKPINEEAAAWQVAKTNPMGRIIYLVMTIRDVSCAVPLIKDPKFSCEVESYMEDKINLLPPHYRLKIRRIISGVFPKFIENTFKNIDLLTNSVVKEIIDDELSFQRKT